MSNPSDYSKILHQAYDQFLLPIGGKEVPAPYRINIPFQLDRKKYGKSTPRELFDNTLEATQIQKFDLKNASVDQVKKFMEKNLLGIDCSGFVYHLLDFLLKQLGRGGMEEIGFPKASRTNVALLTSDEFSVPIKSFSQAQPGDIIKLNSGEDVLHSVIILGKINNIITYAHSSRSTNPTGVHQGQIINGKLPADLQIFSFNTERGDGVRRLKILA